MEETHKISSANVGVVLIGLSLAACLVPMDITIANVAIPYITGSFGVDVASGKSVITSYFIGEAVALPLTGWLVKRFGDIETFIYSLILFAVFSLLCGNSIFLEMLVICRFFQGIASAPLIPLGQSILLRCLPQEKFNLGIGLMSIFFVLSIILGPLLGGYITINWGWPWIFNINPPIVIFCLILIWNQLKGKDLPLSKSALDVTGFILVIIGVGAWQILIDHGQQWDWWNSTKIRYLFFISIVIAFILAVIEWPKPNRYLELPYFKNRNYSIANVIMWVAIFVDLSTLIILPIWLQTYKGFNALWAGIILAPHGIGGVIAGALNSGLVRIFGLFGTSAIGMGLVAISCFYQSFIQTPDIDVIHLIIPRIILGAGIILNYIVLTLACKEEFDTKDQPSAIALFQFSRSIVAATGISLMIALWERRAIFYRNVLIDQVTLFNQNTSQFLNDLQRAGLSQLQSTVKINQITDFQAATLSLNDCYYLMGWLAVSMILFSFLHKKEVKTSHNSEASICSE